MNKSEFLETLQSTRAEWEALLREIGEERMLQPGATGEWTVKDVIAHVMWCEREMLDVMRTRALVGSDLWNVSEDERNAAVVAQHKARPLHDILSEEQQVYAQFLEEARGLSEEELNDARRFRDMPKSWLPWQLLAGCSFAHYREHMQLLRAWLARIQRT